MQNYSIKPTDNQGKKHTILKIVAGDEIVSLFGNYIPYPNDHYSDKLYSNRLVYSWLIDGFFGTADGYKYLNDIIARFKLSCDSADLHSLKMVDDENQSTHKLKAFQGLKSLVKDKLEDLKVNSYINSDYVYTCIVLQAEKYIKANGLIVYSTLEDWAISNFLDIAKDKSTLKAKCRNCWNWYYNRNWALYHTVRIKKNVEEVMATRVQHAKNMAQKKVDENISKIKNAITGLMADSMFKKKNGTWNGKAIADYLSIDPRTVNKYLKEIHRI